jgi:hypothetical protein
MTWPLLTLLVKPEDRPEGPKPGYSTIRFSNEAGGAKGELDRFCAFERTFYFIAIGFMSVMGSLAGRSVTHHLTVLHS